MAAIRLRIAMALLITILLGVILRLLDLVAVFIAFAAAFARIIASSFLRSVSFLSLGVSRIERSLLPLDLAAALFALTSLIFL